MNFFYRGKIRQEVVSVVSGDNEENRTSFTELGA
jgi:hypothetical protein